VQLTNEIHQLLFKHKCVIIPEFGAFLVNEKEVELNKLAKYANPKRSLVSFNRQITNNDGLLANHLCTAQKISYAEATEKIKDYVKHINNVLQERRNAEVKGIGTFYLTPEEKLVFVPYHSVNFNTDSYGLPKIRLTEKSFEEEEQPEVVAQPSEKPVVTTSQQPLKKVEETKLSHQQLEAKRKAKREERQEKKRAQKAEKDSKERISYFSPLNMVATLFLAVMTGFVLYFEQTSDFSYEDGTSYANLVDTPTYVEEAPTVSTEEDVDLPESTKHYLKLYTITTQPLPFEEAEALHTSLISKYSSATVNNVDNGLATVSIIAFSNETLAHEYLSLMQNNVDQKLVITHN
jgi:nucleoid DNA-binding protein